MLLLFEQSGKTTSIHPLYKVKTGSEKNVKIQISRWNLIYQSNVNFEKRLPAPSLLTGKTC